MAELRLLVLTPWYPAADRPYDGVFVRASLAALDHPAETTTIVHLQTVAPGATGTVTREPTEHGTVIRLTVPQAADAPRADVCDAHRAALARADLPELAAADVVHAHVGMPTGAAVAPLLADHQRLVLTEHASYLGAVLARPEARSRYAAAVARAQAVLTVSDAMTRRLRTEFPAQSARVATLGNPVDDTRFGPVAHPPGPRLRWLYLGNFVPGKRVDVVVRSFAAWAVDRPAATLTLVGRGVQQDALVELAASLGVAGQVRFPGPVAPSDVPAVFAAADVLVHLSAVETFGLTVVEAAMTGLPVVVTTSGGPEETLADAAARGQVVFVGKDPSPATVGAAVDRLAEAAPDPAAVREVLVERYGVRGYADRLWAALAGAPAAAPAPGAPVVLLLATSALGGRRLARLETEAHRVGARVGLVATDRADLVAADPRTALLDLATATERLPWRAVEHLLLDTIPVGVLTAARSVLVAAGRLPGPQRTVLRRAVGGLTRALGLRARVARKARTLADKVWHHRVEPLLLAALAARRHAGWWRDLAPDVVVMGDGTSLALAWRIARDLPDATVVGVVSEPALRDLVDRAAAGRSAQA